MTQRIVTLLFVAVLGSAPSCFADSPLNHQQAVQAMKTHPGWTATVIAHEPQIVDPVAVRFARDRRMWVVEMPDYPTGPKPGQPPSGRIRILDDRDGDGMYETATTFADQLLFPTGVQPWRNGAIVTLAGKIMWMQDQDQDGVAETSTVWFEGFAMDNEQLRANHPVLGPDGMVYVAGGLRGGKIRAVDAKFDRHDEVDLRDHDFCFDPDGGSWRAVVGNSQFGMTIDDYGRRVGCSNRNPAFTCVVDDDAIARDLLLAPRDAIEDIAVPAEGSRVNSRTIAWTTSNLHAGQFSAACGVAAPGWFGDGDQSGEWLLVCEPTGYLVQRQWLSNESGSWRSTRDPRSDEFLSTTDSWFRPVDIVAGPGNSIYVADMVRAVIEHPQWAPEELKNRPDTWDGNDRGRIWRIVADRSQTPEPTGTPNVAWLGHSNPWVREVASQFFFEADANAVAPQLRSVIADSTSPPTAVARAARWLAVRQLLDSNSSQRLLHHDDKRVVTVGVELANAADLTGETLTRLTETEDPQVRFAVAARLAARSSTDLAGTDAMSALLAIAKLDGEHPTAIKILGSVDNSQIAALCRASVLDPSFGTQLLSHWWTRWAFQAPQDSLLAILPESGTPDPARTVELFDAWLRGNQITGEKRLSQQTIKMVLGPYRLRHLLTTTEQVATDPMLPADIRCSAVRGTAALGDLPDSFWGLLGDDSPLDVRAAALTASFNHDSVKTCDWLSDRLLTLPPKLRVPAIEQMLSRPASTQWLIDKITAGDFQPAIIPPQIGQRLMQSKDLKVAEQAKALFAVATDRAELIARYRNSPSFAGGLKQADPQQGKQVFARACAVCHRIDGIGVNVGPDISDSRDKMPEAILTSILHPNAAIDAAFLQYSALTTDGRVLDGLLIDDRAEGVTLRRQGGENLFLPRDDLERLQAAGTSLMPDGFERLINETEMANLVAYLKNWRYLTAVE